MKYSRFNILLDKGTYLLAYNTLSKAMVRIKKEDFSIENSLLIDKGFVTAEDEDLKLYKYFYLSRLFDNKNISVSIATTMACNLRCPYCFEEGNKSNEMMSEDVAEAIVKYLVAKRKHEINVTWFGGEPLMNFKVIEKISNSLKEHNVTFSASIITNGTLLTDDMIRKLTHFSINSIQITLDGEQEQHNAKRFFANGKGTYLHILENVDNLLRLSDIRVVLKVNLDKENILSYEKLCKEIKKRYGDYIDKKRVIISHNFVRNRNNFKGCENCLSEEEYFDRFYDNNKAINYISNIAAPCPLRSRSDFAIGPDGNIYKCLEFLGNKKKTVGNILSYDINVKNQACYALDFIPFDDNKCCNCEILPLCGGGCPIDRESAIKQHQQVHCSVLKKRIRQIIEDFLNSSNIK